MKRESRTAEKPRGRVEMDLDLEVMGRRVARARVAADEATPPVDLRSERAGLAAADDMLSLEERRGSRDMGQ